MQAILKIQNKNQNKIAFQTWGNGLDETSFT